MTANTPESVVLKTSELGHFSAAKLLAVNITIWVWFQIALLRWDNNPKRNWLPMESSLIVGEPPIYILLYIYYIILYYIIILYYVMLYYIIL